MIQIIQATTCLLYTSPQSLHLVAIHHGLDEGIEDSLLTGVVSVTVINDNPYRSFSVQVRCV